ncbi:MAG: PDC sensor domain-containing protein [Deltaproteobacteria bacterium]|nr:PDC sensor domain-containing protein [Deltaproteobacteria bacterium]
MTIRWKLLALLLGIALVPLLFVSWFDQRTTRQAGQDMAALGRQILKEGASRQLIQIVDDYAMILRRERQLLELALHLQAGEVEKALAGPAPRLGTIYFDQDFDQGRNLPPGVLLSSEHFIRQDSNRFRPMRVSYLAQVFKLAPGVKKQNVAKEAARLSTVLDTYRQLERNYPDLIYWQSTTLESGLHSAYPAHGGYPADYDPRHSEWYIRAKEAGSLIWNPPRLDASTTQLLLTVARPVHRPDGSLAGVTAIDVSLPSILQETKLP